MKKNIIINLIVLYFFISAIIIFSPLLIDFYKFVSTKYYEDKRYELPNYKNTDWAKKHFQEFNKLKSSYYDHIVWRRNDFNGETITIKNSYRMNNKDENFQLNKDIWVFGGSTIWGTGSNDKNTIPSLIEQLTKITTLNLGESGYTSTQELNLLNKEIIKHKPKMIIFYDGVNDVKKCFIHRNYFSTEKENWIRSELMKGEFANSKNLIISPMKIVTKVSTFFKKKNENIYDCDTNLSKTDEIVKTFVNNWLKVKYIADKNNIKFIPILQPTLFSSTSNQSDLTLNSKLEIQYEIVYDLIKKELKNINFNYLNLENSLNENYFIDFAHLSPNGNLEITKKIINSDFFKN